MRLSTFIRDNMEVILQEWEDFAVSLSPLSGLSKLKLRDHAQQMLHVICLDLDTDQGEMDGIEKSKGHAPEVAGDTAAEIHAADRLLSGLTIEELMAEYRAVRASVLRLWQKKVQGADAFEVRDILRFNEAIDQSLTESVARYSEMLRESQSVFLAILGHDVRNPLGAISMGAQILMLDPALAPKYVATATRILGSTKRVNEIVSDLLDFSTSHLGGGIPVAPATFDFAPECKLVVDEMRAFHPLREIELHSEGELTVRWDRARVNQAVSNLLANALEHGAKEHPVWVAVTARGEDITLTIQNMGQILDPASLRTMFDPAKRFAMRPASERGADRVAHLGLGLYITREIVSAHGGQIRVNSSDSDGTTFTIRIPRGGPKEVAPNE
ncbi:MAG: HAMP domain-containing sensor histidine kinase [Pseudomonadota bacterium]